MSRLDDLREKINNSFGLTGEEHEEWLALEAEKSQKKASSKVKKEDSKVADQEDSKPTEDVVDAE